VLAVLAMLAVPLSLQVYPGDVTAVFPWGLLGVESLSVTTLPDFLFRYTAGLPAHIRAWPLAVAVWLLALLSACLGLLGREDPRITAGLLALAGVVAVRISLGFAVQPGRTAYPLGSVALWVLAWWVWRTR
jgi:uncharacterized protein (TIGR04206 family)